MDEIPEITTDTTVTSAKKSLQSAGSLIAKKTERTKLATVTIPRAYAELGKSVYKDAGKRGAFTSLFEQLDKLLAERKRINDDAKARPSASTFTDKAKQVAAEATDLAKTKAIDLKVYKAFASLGESAYTQVGVDFGPKEVVGPLATAIARRDLLDSETATIEASSKGKWITPRRLVIGGGTLLALMVLSIFGSDENPIPGKPEVMDTRRQGRIDELTKQIAKCDAELKAIHKEITSLEQMDRGSPERSHLESIYNKQNELTSAGFQLSQERLALINASKKADKLVRRRSKFPPIGKLSGTTDRDHNAYKEGFEEGCNDAMDRIEEIEATAGRNNAKKYLNEHPEDSAILERQRHSMLMEIDRLGTQVGLTTANLAQAGVTKNLHLQPAVAAANEAYYRSLGRSLGFTKIINPLLAD
jgi:hypothetical protein